MNREYFEISISEALPTISIRDQDLDEVISFVEDELFEELAKFLYDNYNEFTITEDHIKKLADVLEMESEYCGDEYSNRGTLPKEAQYKEVNVAYTKCCNVVAHFSYFQFFKYQWNCPKCDREVNSIYFKKELVKI